MLQVEATPTIGLVKSSSEKPTVRNMERFGALSVPSTTMDEYFLEICDFVVVTVNL